MAKIKITQIRSSIRRTGKQKKTLESLGLNKILIKNINLIKPKHKKHENTPNILGMIKKVNHLVVVNGS